MDCCFSSCTFASVIWLTILNPAWATRLPVPFLTYLCLHPCLFSHLEYHLLCFSSCPNLLILQLPGTLFFFNICLFLAASGLCSGIMDLCSSMWIFRYAHGLFMAMCGFLSICGMPAVEHAGSVVVVWRLSCLEHDLHSPTRDQMRVPCFGRKAGS